MTLGEEDNDSAKQADLDNGLEFKEERTISIKSLWMNGYESLARSMPKAMESMGAEISDVRVTLVTDFGIVTGIALKDDDDRVRANPGNQGASLFAGSFVTDIVEREFEKLEDKTEELSFSDRDWPVILRDVTVTAWESPRSANFAELAVFISSIRAVTLGS